MGRSERRRWCQIYISGLLLDGDRKSVQRIAERVEGGNEQALQQFVNQSPWSYGEVLKALRKYFQPRFSIHRPLLILEDLVLPKKGRHSVGVARQSSRAQARRSNCQIVVSWHAVADELHVPLSARLFLPEEWTGDDRRMDAARIPEDRRAFGERWEIALDLLDELRVELEPEAVVIGAEYYGNRAFTRGLEDRNLPFIAKLDGKEMFWEVESGPGGSGADGAAGPNSPRRGAGGGRKVALSAQEWSRKLFPDAGSREAHPLDMEPDRMCGYAEVVVHEPAWNAPHRIGAKRRLIVERREDGGTRYYVSNLPDSVPSSEIVFKAHSHSRVENGCARLRKELGINHFEGRSWGGLHRHVSLCFLAFSFLQILRFQGPKSVPSQAKRRYPDVRRLKAGARKYR